MLTVVRFDTGGVGSSLENKRIEEKYFELS